MSFFENIFQDVIALAILLFFGLWVYSARKGLSFKELLSELNGLWK